MIPVEFLVFFFGIAAALSWGAGDFSGGLASKRANIYSVVIISQATGVLILSSLAYYFSESIPPLNTIAWALVAGTFGCIGILSLYRGLSQGKMGIVAPVSAVTAVTVPVIYSGFNEGMPAVNQAIGFVIAIAGVWLIASDGKTKINPNELSLPLFAGICFAAFFISIDHFDEASLLWPLTFARLTAMAILLCFIGLTGPVSFPSKSVLPMIIVAGILETGGNMFFTLASQAGRLDIATVTSSLYPGGTVLLAWIILKEKLAPRQWVGVAAALVAIVLISA